VTGLPGTIEGRPLAGRTILITRAREQAGVLESTLAGLGAGILSIPAIEFTDPDDYGPLDRALSSLDSWDWIVFTSANGVAWFWKRFASLRFPAAEGAGDALARALSGIHVAAIGPATAASLSERGVVPDVVPRVYRAEELAASLPLDTLRGRRVLIARAQKAREVLPEILRRAGAEVEIAACYRTVPPPVDCESLARRLEAREIDLVTFTSSSTVENFVSLFPSGEAARLLSSVKIACIGPITADTAISHGLGPDATAGEYTIPGLVRVVVDLLAPA
jgi:uroporphyrinogen III methyltransferase/synthase